MWLWPVVFSLWCTVFQARDTADEEMTPFPVFPDDNSKVILELWMCEGNRVHSCASTSTL